MWTDEYDTGQEACGALYEAYGTPVPPDSDTRGECNIRTTESAKLKQAEACICQATGTALCSCLHVTVCNLPFNQQRNDRETAAAVLII